MTGFTEGLIGLGPGGLFSLGAFCLFMSAFYSGCETGYMSISRVRLRTLARADSTPVRRLLQQLRRIEDPILTCLIGTNLFNVFFTALVTAVFTERYGARGEWLAVVVVSILVILLGEILPKVLFLEFPERLTLVASPVIAVAMALLAPLRWLLGVYTDLWRRILPAADQGRSGMTRRSLAALMLTNIVPSEGDQRFADTVDRFLELEGHPLSNLMRPLDRLVTVETDATVSECLSVAAKLGFSRFPVMREDGKEVQGYLLVRDLLFLPLEDHQLVLPRRFIRPILLVDERMSPYELFEELRSQSRQLAVVVDGSGNPLGMVTLEDLIETVIGSIQDEFDPPEQEQSFSGQIPVRQRRDHGKQ